jgi:hypothetical protein
MKLTMSPMAAVVEGGSNVSELFIPTVTIRFAYADVSDGTLRHITDIPRRRRRELSQQVRGSQKNAFWIEITGDYGDL